jgi:Rps23 Pro-64 3,4-dihydroxylase Tpa1-like proline 4-hydroxylase
MTPLEAKEHLHKKGYCSFNIADLSSELFDIVNQYKCDTNSSQRENMIFLRGDFSESSGEAGINTNFKIFEEANKIKNEKLSLLKKEDIVQIWLYGHPKGGSTPLRKLYTELTKYFYDIDDTVDLNMDISISLYNKGCFLNDHIDGKSPVKNYASILVYLNKDWKAEDGGNLILRGDDNVDYKVVPEFGTVAIIDLQNFDIYHQVEEVLNDVERYTIICFPFDKKNLVKND